MSRARIPVALAAVTTAVLMLSAVPAVPAGAHGATGTLGLEATPGTAPLTARVRALLEYSNDREVAPGATVTVGGRDATGQTVGPQALADQGRGLYEATLTLPAAGAWTLTVTAVNPAATAQTSVTVSASAPAATTPTTAPGDVRTSSDEAAADRADQDSTNASDDGVSVVVVVGIMLVVGIAIGTAAAFARRRTPR